MLCLKCGTDNSIEHPWCKECLSFVGYIRENRGFLPQLELIQQGIQSGEIEASDAAERLQRLEAALHFMIHNLDETGANLVNLNLDEGQQATLGGFLMPARQGLESFLEVVTALEPDGNWGEEDWANLMEAHSQIIKGTEGIQFLTRTVAGMAQEAGADFSQMGKPRENAESEGAEAASKAE